MCYLILVLTFLLCRQISSIRKGPEQPYNWENPVPAAPRDFSGVYIDNTIMKPSSEHEYYPIKQLDEGRWSLRQFPGVHYDYYMQSKFAYCDFQISYEPKTREDVAYVGAVCDVEEDCLNWGPFEATSWGNLTCRKWAQDSFQRSGFPNEEEAKRQVCCPVNTTRLWKEDVLLVNLTSETNVYEYERLREIPITYEYENTSYAYYTGKAAKYMERDTIAKLLDEGYAKTFAKARVCGFKKNLIVGKSKGDPPYYDLYDYSPFFCVLPEQCSNTTRTSQDQSAEPLWHQFCQPRFDPEPPDVNLPGDYSYVYEPTSPNNYCCHVDFIVGVFDKQYHSVRQLPTYLNYAVGFRSAYKCEEYARRACEGDYDWCVTEKSGPTSFGRNPHMASLGFVAPKLLQFFCGGAIISVRFILSSASCGNYFGYTTNVVLVGEHKTENVFEHVETEKTYLISDIHKLDGIPPAFRKKPWQDSYTLDGGAVIDIALYRTEVEIVLSHYIRPACIWYGQQGWPEEVEFIGFGSTSSYRSEHIKTLTGLTRTTDCKLASNFDPIENEHYGFYGAKNAFEVCYEDVRNVTQTSKIDRNPCKVDRGGPLQVRMQTPHCSTRILGILASNSDCKRWVPNVFINISHFIGAIEDEVWGNNFLLDLNPQQFEAVKCGNQNIHDMFFFNKCPGGVAC